MNDNTKGRHLIVTGFVAEGKEDRLWSKSFLSVLLETVIKEVGMTVLIPPQMVIVPSNPSKADGPEDDGGVTGVAVLSTSHAAIHTWPLHRRVSFDLYSCHDFDVGLVVAFLKGSLELRDADIVDIDRTAPERGSGFSWFPIHRKVGRAVQGAGPENRIG